MLRTSLFPEECSYAENKSLLVLIRAGGAAAGGAGAGEGAGAGAAGVGGSESPPGGGTCERLSHSASLAPRGGKRRPSSLAERARRRVWGSAKLVRTPHVGRFASEQGRGPLGGRPCASAAPQAGEALAAGARASGGVGRAGVGAPGPSPFCRRVGTGWESARLRGVGGRSGRGALPGGAPAPSARLFEGGWRLARLRRRRLSPSRWSACQRQFGAPHPSGAAPLAERQVGSGGPELSSSRRVPLAGRRPRRERAAATAAARGALLSGRS